MRFGFVVVRAHVKVPQIRVLLVDSPSEALLNSQVIVTCSHKVAFTGLLSPALPLLPQKFPVPQYNVAPFFFVFSKLQ